MKLNVHRILIVGMLATVAQAASAFAETFSDEKILDAYHRVAADRAPGLFEPLIRYDATPVSVSCDDKRAPVTHAILIGASDPGFVPAGLVAESTINDTELIQGLMQDRGVDAARIHRILGRDATRDRIVNALVAVLADVQCEDRVLFFFSGHSLPAKRMLEASLLRGEALVDPDVWEQYFGKDMLEPTIEKLDEVSYRFEGAEAGQWRDIEMLLHDEVAFLVYEAREHHFGVFLGRDVSEFMIAVRNKGAHAVAVFDSENVSTARIEDRQLNADVASFWTYRFTTRGSSAEQSSTLVPGHGSYSVFYATGAGEQAMERPGLGDDPNRRQYGMFTVAFAGTLLDNPLATPRHIAATIDESYRRMYRLVAGPRPKIVSSQPDLPLIAEVAPQSSKPIKILYPAPQRGAAVMQKASVDIEGIVEWSAPVLGVFVDDDEAKLEPDGRFTDTVALNPGLNTISIRAVTADNRLHSERLEFIFEGDRQALVGEGRHYAVVIANQNYGANTGMPSLSTPLADADAVAEVLTGKYGFEMKLPLADGKSLPLVLKDPTKRDIEFALHQLGKVAGMNDVVLIFYAGHGVYEPVTSTAYWVARDAEMGFEPSYLSAADISAAVQRMQAGSVILISDSCYSGALLRGGELQAEPIDEAQRLQALLKLQSRRSRIVISSGNNEPVADLGGGGHSVFARALLNGLESMTPDAFTARELFDDYILPQVTANADQEPQFRPLEKAGHEGGDFVFVKAAQASAGKSVPGGTWNAREKLACCLTPLPAPDNPSPPRT